MQPVATPIEPITPSAELSALQPGEWGAMPETDPLLQHIAESYWPHPERPLAWQAARFSKAVYLFQEMTTSWTLVVKFYEAKTGRSAGKYALQELEQIEWARAAGLAEGTMRSLQAFGAWRGVLFLEHVDGLTLADAIAVRRSRPGELRAGLAVVAGLLARLHTDGAQPQVTPDFQRAVAEALEFVGELASSGILKGEKTVADGLDSLIGRWSANPAMDQFTPAVIHGDATTTNFVFPDRGGVVAIDWERLEVADPAADLGRLAAEVWHSVGQQGGRGQEAAALTQWLLDAYCKALPATVTSQALLERTRFHQASSTLRIARNKWLSPSERMALVTQAMGLLAI